MSEFEKWHMVKVVNGIWDVRRESGHLIGRELTQEQAEQILQEHNAFPKLVKALDMWNDIELVNFDEEYDWAARMNQKYKLGLIDIDPNYVLDFLQSRLSDAVQTALDLAR